MDINLITVALAALIPMIVGFVYYHPKVMGTKWMAATGMTEEKMKGSNMGLIYGLSLLLAFMLAFFLVSLTVHQQAVKSLFFGDFDNPLIQTIMDAKGDAFRTFKHGAFHGIIASIFFVLPVFATNAMFERKGGKYIWVNWLYWAITITLMAGVICQFA